MKKEIVCIICPEGCRITVEGEGNQVNSTENSGCKRGEEYAINEFVSPCRILTTTVRVPGRRMLPVRSSKPVPRELLLPCMAEIKKKTAEVPVWMHQVILPDILGTGIDVISCMPME
jgi:CxxC motif-containing protein